VMNCAYNAISALGRAPYGEMVAVAEIRTIMSDAVREVVAVAAAKGVLLPANIVDVAMKLADGMPVTMSSTAQDIRRGRRTEIDHLNGYVVREGDARGIAVPAKNYGHDLEAMQKISDPPLKKCPHCGKSQLQRLMSAPVFRLKGGGWYETDFKGDKDNQRNLADRPEAEAAKAHALMESGAHIGKLVLRW